jgi:dihydrolipoamide dehydrogenase
MPPYTSINLHPQIYPPSVLKTHTYDVICIGSGWAGCIIAASIFKAGLTAIIIEKELVGGDCPFWACVPSKAILRPNEALDEARAVSGVKEKLTEGGVVVDEVFKRRDRYTRNFDDGAVLVPLVERSGAALVRGTGRIIGEKAVRVESLNVESIDLEARLAVAICTGSKPVIPHALKDAQPWTPREATSSSVVLGHLVIVGAGAVGIEMATAYNSFGAKVTLLSSIEEIISKIDPEGAQLVRENLISKGIDIFLSTTAVAATREADRSVTVHLERKNHHSQRNPRHSRTPGTNLKYRPCKVSPQNRRLPHSRR